MDHVIELDPLPAFVLPPRASAPEPSIETRRCGLCAEDLPVGDFGICRARRSGRNLYCKECIRKKGKQGRRVVKEYLAVNLELEQSRVAAKRELVEEAPADSVEPLSLEERVFEVNRFQARRFRLLTGRARSISEAGILRHLAACAANGCEPDLDAIREIITDAQNGLSVFKQGPARTPDPAEPPSFGVSTIYQG